MTTLGELGVRFPEPEPSLLKKVGDAGAAAAKDVGRGFVEAPGAVAAGIVDATQNAGLPALIERLATVADWLNQNVADLRIPIGKTGYPSLDRFLADPLRAAASGMSEKIPPPQSVTGGLIRDTVRFGTGFVPANRALRAVGVGGKASAIAAGGISEGVTHDPNEPNITRQLSDWLHGPRK